MEHSSFLAPRPARAFTLIEMMVVVGIIGLITVIVLNGQVTFDNQYSITDTAYTIALSIREAQTFGLSSRTDTGVVNTGYGVEFKPGKTYFLFGDVYGAALGTLANCPVGALGAYDSKPGNCVFDATHDTTAQSFSLNRGFAIADVCGKRLGVPKCVSTADITGIDVVFFRPNTDSVVTGLTTGLPIILDDAQIKLTAPQGGTRYICITSVGEVSVTSSSCP